MANCAAVRVAPRLQFNMLALDAVVRFARCTELISTDLRITKRAVESWDKLPVNRAAVACESVLMFAGAREVLSCRAVRRHTLKKRNGERICAMRVARDMRDAYHLRKLGVIADANLFAD